MKELNREEALIKIFEQRKILENISKDEKAKTSERLKASEILLKSMKAFSKNEFDRSFPTSREEMLDSILS